jgi:hypothetical protein
MDTILPGLIARFGPNQPLEVLVATRDSPLSYMKPGELGLDVTIQLTLFVNGVVACVIDVIDAKTVVALSLKQYLVRLQFLSFYINESEVVKTEIGPIDVESKRRFVNLMAYLTIPVINAVIAAGYEIPHVLLGFI